ncbi:MAG: AtpZ/AtpI family protein [Chloroflexi bacterium]|nr:AtpZ/AtpI family protein [Chloroflexota bacterium]
MRRLPVGLRLLGLGWYVAICIVLGILGGLWLDGKTGKIPLFTLLGLFLGLIAAFTGLYRMVNETVEEEDRQERENDR